MYQSYDCKGRKKGPNFKKILPYYSRKYTRARRQTLVVLEGEDLMATHDARIRLFFYKIKTKINIFNEIRYLLMNVKKKEICYDIQKIKIQKYLLITYITIRFRR